MAGRYGLNLSRLWPVPVGGLGIPLFVFFVCSVPGVVANGQVQYLGFEVSRERDLLERPPHEFLVAGDWSCVESSGRRWDSMPTRGGRCGGTLGRGLVWGSPGPSAYGVRSDDERLITVRVGATAVRVSPWVRVDGEGGLRRIEQARRLWLAQQGYTGGTRRFLSSGGEHETDDGTEESRVPSGDGWRVIEVPRRGIGEGGSRWRVRRSEEARDDGAEVRYASGWDSEDGRVRYVTGPTRRAQQEMDKQATVRSGRGERNLSGS